MSSSSCVVSGLVLPPCPGGIFIEAINAPIDFIIVRASSIPEWVMDKDSHLKAGITGSDIIWNSGLGKDFGEEIPLYALNPKIKQPSLYIGATKEFSEQVRSSKLREPMPADLVGETIVTKYCRIANNVFSERQVAIKTPFYVPGTDEAIKYFYDYFGILGIKSSGKTAEMNEIEVWEIFYQVSIRMIEAANKLTEQERNVLNDFKERIAVVLEKKRMV